MAFTTGVSGSSSPVRTNAATSPNKPEKLKVDNIDDLTSLSTLKSSLLTRTECDRFKDDDEDDEDDDDNGNEDDAMTDFNCTSISSVDASISSHLSSIVL